MRREKALINVACSLLLQITTIIAGFIVPRLFINSFGSDVNGLVNSITSFIGYITLLQTGVGSAVKAALYKPLAKKNHLELCEIVKTADLFFKKIAIVTIIYIIALTVAFPLFIVDGFDWFYTSSLVVIIGLSIVAQYFFGITYQMVLEADQRAYIYSVIQTLSIIVNTVVIVVLIHMNYSVQIVKLASTLVFVIRPIILNIYTKRKYEINLTVDSQPKLLAQRWDAFAQGLAYFIHSKTDVLVLTLFATLKDVSIYSVYALITAGLSSFITAIDSAIRSAFGNIIANDEKQTLLKGFEAYNTLLHILATVMFATASITVAGFIHLYVGDVTDANYQQPFFALVIILAEYLFCLRSPYNSIIYAAGMFKETKVSAGLEAAINIVLSCILVPHLGLIGVAIGTLIAMLYRTISFIHFLHNNILCFSYYSQIKRISISILSYVITVSILSRIQISTGSYYEWIVYAFAVLLLVSLFVIITNFIFYKTETIRAFKMLIRRPT